MPELGSATRVFAAVTVGALVGMVMGGLFGWGSGELAPGLFQAIFPFGPMIKQPVGTAVVMGASGGVCLGGALVVFALVLGRADRWLASRRHQTPIHTDAG